ncbi:ABC transporter substrate-binding protein [Flammeovirga agarivorans]|uniref:ABC transporter substrate-binding protein n=1 Tax=Flammeovirga agarivorans TaxID=2726742 RepID=A0A7X8SKT0_9BACT|nr:ABC transporter substrate-binding protein [Flammeovirga agarivorans]NLR91962.1 ABC transporter substrate-binding protein [Flammeovirga agarivorans]
MQLNKSLYTIVLSFLILFFGCQQKENKQTSQKENQEQNIGSVKSEVLHAKTFKLEYKDNLKLLHFINPFNDGQETFVLLPKGNSLPDQYKGHQVISIPVKNVITTTTAQTSMMEELGSIDAIRGYVDKTYMYSQDIIDRMEEGRIISVGYDMEGNAEKVILSDADLVMVVGSSSTSSNSFPVIQKAGIPILANTDWQESDLLGRAEWIKVFGALLNKEAEANALFESITKQYNEYKHLATQAKSSPKVISGLPYKGLWSVPGGASYLAKAFHDVHVDYPWFDNDQKGSLQFDLEGVYAKGKDAKYWINVGMINSLEELKGVDKRYAEFDAFTNGGIYNNNNKMNKAANDYWGTGILHPEIILADLIKIFHPELLPDHELYFFQKIN